MVTVQRQFETDPQAYFDAVEHDRAVRALRAYRERYTGAWFDDLAARGEDASPARFRAEDIIAVEMLAITVPAPTIRRLLNDRDVVDEIARHLTNVPTHTPIWTLADDDPAWDHLQAVWKLLGQMEGLVRGRTTKSKLLAAKRPHLVPVYDRQVARVLLGARPRKMDDWRLWRKLLTGPDGEHVRQLVDGAKGTAGCPGHLSTLRTIDVVVWMRSYGWTQSPVGLEDFAQPLGEP